jgi:hypothetical protein
MSKRRKEIHGKGSYKYAIDGVVQLDANCMQTFDARKKHVFFLGLPQPTTLQFENRDGLCSSPNKSQIKIEILTDKYGREDTSWSLIDSKCWTKTIKE